MKIGAHSGPYVDLWTLVGLALLVGPLDTMLHEIGGHAAACALLGGRITDIGAYYVECANTGAFGRRLVAMAGTFADLLAFGIGFLVWRRLSGDFVRLAAWLTFTVKGMVAAGYFLFSGATGMGDWGPGADGGIGPLPAEPAWRIGLFLVGLAAYIAVVRLAMRTLDTMIGGTAAAWPTRKRIALGFYIVNGIAAVLVGLMNPQGIFIVLGSAAASSFGGTAGMFNIAYGRPNGDPRGFFVGRRIAVLVAGIACLGGFAAILGPTLKFGN